MDKNWNGRISRRELMAAGAATLAGSTLLTLAGCAGSAVIGQVDDYTLDVGYAEYTIDGLRFRTRTYNGTVPGPTITTAPGRKLRITINNNLPPNPLGGDGGIPEDHGHAPVSRVAAPTNPNNPHDFNTTNLHVHGLQVRPHLFAPLGTSSPNSHMIAIEPGESYTYDFDIPADQPSGLYWYHPHHHGSTAVQVYNGMAGLIVVRGPIDEVPEIAAAREEFVAVTVLRASPSAADPNLYVNDPIANEPASEGGFTQNQKRNYYLVNGQPVAWYNDDAAPAINQLSVPTIPMQPGEVVRVRFLNGADAQLMPIQLDSHDIHLIAYDGVNVLEPQTMDTLELPPGGRGEFMVKAGTTPGTYGLRMLPVSGQQGNDAQGFLIVNFSIAGAAKDMSLPTSLPTPTREYPFIEEHEIASTFNLDMSRIAPYPDLLTNVGFPMNGQLYDEERIDRTVTRGTAEEWIVTTSGRDGHPFHIHVTSFWVVELNGVPLDPPVVKDVVWIPPLGSVKLRMRFHEYTGKSVYHCHVLFHEDTGMMSNFLIQ